MYKPLETRLRKDLLITTIVYPETSKQSYSFKKPSSGEAFEFGEEEYFLCKSMDGISTPSEILAAFERHFGLVLTEEDFNQFSQQIAECGLLEAFDEQDQFPLGTSSLESEEENKESQFSTLSKRRKKEKRGKVWAVSNSEVFFKFLAKITKPFKPIANFLLWLLIPLLILALFTIFNNQSLFRRDIGLLVKPTSWVAYHLLNMIVVNLTSKLAQGIVCTYYGGTVGEFGLKLTFGILPRFYLKKDGIWQLPRKIQLWSFGTPLVIRILIFSLGTLIWYWTKGTENGLRGWAISLAYMGYLDFLIDSSPFWPSDGYGLMIAYFRLPPNWLKKNLLIFDMILKRRPLPKRLTFPEKLKLQGLSLLMILTWVFLALKLVNDMSHRLLKNISPGILGNGATALLISLPFMLGFRTLWIATHPKQDRKKSHNQDKLEKTSNGSWQTPLSHPLGEVDWFLSDFPKSVNKSNSFNKILKSWVKKFIRISLLVALGILLFLPYPYRPGGVIKISPPTQQQIQAQVKGKITKVFFEGGDGQWIKAGTVIANLEAVDIENSVLITQEQVRQQQAELEKQQANLKKLLATPRKEDVEVEKQQVEVEKQQVEVAKQQVEVAQEQLKTAIGKAEFSSRQAERYKALYNTGAFSLQQYENSAKDAETDRNNVEEAKQNVEEAKQNVEKKRQDIKKAQANLASVLSGPFPEEIEAARKEVEAARANLKRLQQQLKYNQDQVKRTPLVMPIDGYLVTSSLNQKVGSYLEQGEMFAVAEDNRHIRGEVEVPEYDIGDFSVGRKVEVKLLAYPDKPLTGEVVSVEPLAASDSTNLTNADESTSSLTEQFVKVTVDLPNTDRLLKAGMSGYAKIEGRTMPVIAAFTRSIVRFVQVEIWSWLP
jgi:multidrug resistance efflux pump